jgi:hypothetical protein
MNLFQKHLYLVALVLATTIVAPLNAQQEGPIATQALIAFDSKVPVTPTPANVTLKIDNHATPITSLKRVVPSGSQVALLIDDGLRTSVGRELGSLRSFIQTLPAGTEVLVGYMQNGRVVSEATFSTDLASVAGNLRIPMGAAGISASPYFCLSDFVKNWPGVEENQNPGAASGTVRKARFVMMITNGVDPYNGSTSPMNQNSPYVDAAVTDAQRVGVPVYSIYFSDAGLRGGQASFSGQSYLQEIADGTGGRAYYSGIGNPVSMAPFLTQFQQAVASTYVATFDTPAKKNFVRVNVKTNLSHIKVRAANLVRTGAVLSSGGR